MLENIRNAITRLPMNQLGSNLGGRIPSCYRHVRHDAVAMVVRTLPRNSALNILQLWASGGRTREPILMKFGIQQQARTSMSVTESFFFNSKLRTAAMLENIRNAITRLPMDQLGWNLGGRIPWCSQHVAILRLSWQPPLPSNGTLNNLQLWASGARTREPISTKFGTQQQVRTSMTATRSSIKIFKIQNGGRPPC